MVLAKRLRERRERAGVSQEEAAEALDVSFATVWRMEGAKTSLRTLYLRSLLRHYGADEEEVEEFVQLAKKAEEPGWWNAFREALPEWFGVYLSLESEARLIAAYEPHYVSGLLQTPAYARATLRVGFPHESEAQLDRRVELRMRRQRILERTAPPTLWLVMDETALRRVIGGPEVMRAQIDALLHAMQYEHIALSVLPFGAGAHPGTGGHYSYLRFAEPEIPDTVYLESLSSAQYFQERDDIEPYLNAHTVMAAMASETVPDLRQWLHDLRKEYEYA
ncbi:helix-turn-helix domain-containing protein [Streptomyces boncukensis]|uniref:Helix-turn-helix domain-containing protein n=1 Tax=Streptomyces boncukensis TaxID=2711219 RepID=A0A6G4X1T6_9ACTN|nr:helix-turn-helix transcriptional regulator [Streptomyces boncukensis]NGO71092.1 helix-turn-helix domain-containing protein [Streptomyces boncukensis]